MLVVLPTESTGKHKTTITGRGEFPEAVVRQILGRLPELFSLLFLRQMVSNIFVVVWFGFRLRQKWVSGILALSFSTLHNSVSVLWRVFTFTVLIYWRTSRAGRPLLHSSKTETAVFSAVSERPRAELQTAVNIREGGESLIHIGGVLQLLCCVLWRKTSQPLLDRKTRGTFFWCHLGGDALERFPMEIFSVSLSLRTLT